jgi:hypothetical protein
MTDLTLVGAERSAPAATAGALALCIPVPARLPARHVGEPLRHLSPSSYTLWVSCPDAWRRRYLKGEKPPPSGSTFLGSRIDEALSAYHRRILEHGDRLALDQLLDLYRDPWHLEPRRGAREAGIEWEDELTERPAFDIGRQAIELAMAELIPQLGYPVEVKRRLEFTLAPGLELAVMCYLDLETLNERAAGEPAPNVIDLTVKSTPISHERADCDRHAGIYLAGRWLEGHPARGLLFAQIAKPGKRRKQITASLVSTTRAAGQMRSALARVALPASQIAACYERNGRDQPWGFADPNQLEVQAALVPCVGQLPRRQGSVANEQSRSPEKTPDPGRGLLSRSCNAGLGQFYDNRILFRRAAASI